MTLSRKILLPLVLLTFSFLSVAVTKQTHAEDRDGWARYFSPIGLFSVRMPANYEEKRSALKLNNDQIVFSETIKATVDQRPFRPSVKTHIVKLDQTIGQPFGKKQIQGMIKADIANYIEHYRSKDALLIEKKYGEILGNLYGEIDMIYDDDDLGPQGVRVRLTYTSNSKLQQIMVGPDDILNSTLANDFFESLQLKDGITTETDQFNANWRIQQSPLEIFSQAYPLKEAPFIKNELEISSDDTSERVGLIVDDPLTGNKLHFNVYGYDLPKSLVYEDAENFLIKKHISKYSNTFEGIQINKANSDMAYMISTNFRARGSKIANNDDMVILNLYFLKNYVVVQELYGVPSLTTSSVADTLQASLEFHPKQAYELKKTKAAIGDKIDLMIDDDNWDVQPDE